MEELTTVLKFISDYGLSIVICGVFLYIILRVVNIWLKNMENKLTSKNDRKGHDSLIELRSNIGEQVQTLINETLIHTESNRVHVIEFSNSVVSVAYLPFRYMSCTYEAYSLGRQATGHKIDRISTSLFNEFFRKLQEDHHLAFDIRDKACLVGGAMCELMKQQKEYHALCAPMKSPSGKFIGFVYLTKDSEFSEDDESTIETLADKISALLCIADQ